MSNNNDDKHGIYESIKRGVKTRVEESKKDLQERIEHPQQYKYKKHEERIRELHRDTNELRAELEKAKIRRELYRVQNPPTHPLSRQDFRNASKNYKKSAKRYKSKKQHTAPRSQPTQLGIPDIMSQRYW